MNNLLSGDNVVFRVYASYAVLLFFKMIFMALITGVTRYRKQVFITPEDTAMAQGEVKYDDPDIERIRRAHMNDLENIPIFLITGILFVLADPNPMIATNLIRLYTAFRFLHTIVYAFIIIRQPTRSIMFTGGVLVNITMAVMVMIKFMHV